jgi:leader peptidase (prepilin peptidase) / N-methyltransferase
VGAGPGARSEVSPDLFSVLLATLLGLVLGSFLNVCALRWPQDQSVVLPRSRCPQCATPLAWYDNIPVLSWIVLRGRCRGCRAAISPQYPLVELLTGGIWGGMVFLLGPTPEALRGALFLTLLLGIALSDARFYIIPDPFSVGGAVLGVGLSFLPGGLDWSQSLLGALVGFTLLAAVAWIGEKLFRKEAMGGGDIKMMAMLGAFLGSTGVLLTLFLGSLLGTLLFAPFAWRSGKLVPFGVFLALGGAVTYLFGEAIVALYMDWAFPPRG